MPAGSSRSAISTIDAYGRTGVEIITLQGRPGKVNGRDKYVSGQDHKEWQYMVFPGTKVLLDETGTGRKKNV